MLAAIGRSALRSGLGALAIGMFSAVRTEAEALCAAVAEDYPMYDDPADLFEADCVGRPVDALLYHSRFEGMTCKADVIRVAADYTETIAEFGGFDHDRDHRFLSWRQREIARGILLDIECRAKGEPLPKIGWLHEAARRYADYKKRHGLADYHELATAPLWPQSRVRLLLLDDVTEVGALKKVFPNAAVVASTP